MARCGFAKPRICRRLSLSASQSEKAFPNLTDCQTCPTICLTSSHLLYRFFSSLDYETKQVAGLIGCIIHAIAANCCPWISKIGELPRLSFIIRFSMQKLLRTPVNSLCSAGRARSGLRCTGLRNTWERWRPGYVGFWGVSMRARILRAQSRRCAIWFGGPVLFNINRPED